MTYLIRMVDRQYKDYYRFNDRKLAFELETHSDDKFDIYLEIKKRWPDYIYCRRHRLEKKLPNGWKKLQGTLTAPNGYYWASNGKSFFDKNYESALIKEN